MNRESDGVKKRLQNQVYGQNKSKLVDTFASGKTSLFGIVDFSLYCFLSSLSNFNNFWLYQKLLPSLTLRLIWHKLCLPCFLPARFTCICAILWYQNKCKLPIVNEQNNTYHRIIKIKPVDVKLSTDIDSSKEINHKNPQCKISDIIRISKYKNIFPKVNGPHWSEEPLVIQKSFKNTVPRTNVIGDIKGQ